MKNEYIQFNESYFNSERLAHQSQGRELDLNEVALAKALMEIFDKGIHDFNEVANALKSMKIIAPRSGSVHWTVELLNEELNETNKQLDLAYKENGFGA